MTRAPLLLPLLAAVAVLAPTCAWAQASPSPAPTHLDQGKPSCGYAEFGVDRPVIRSGDVVTVTVTRRSAEPGGVTAELIRRSPGPAATVRSDTSTATVVTWSLRLGESHDFTASSTTQRPEECYPLGRPSGFPLEVDVEPRVSLTAVRRAPRDYAFSGRVLPAKGQAVSLYRHAADGRRILTAQGTVAPDGTYRIDRRFTGSGRFGFSVAVPASTAHLAGSSPTRPTVVH